MADIIGYGAKLSYSNDGVSYTDCAGVVDVAHPSIKVKKVDMTANDTVNATRIYKPGLGDTDDIEFKLKFDKTLLGVLYGFYRTTKYWKVTVPDAGTTDSAWTFQGFISEYGGEIPMDDKVMMSIKIAPTTKPAFVAGT